MKKVVFALILLVILSGCNEPPQTGEVPVDFDVSYSTGAAHIEWGSTEIHLSHDGTGYMKKTMGRFMETTKNFSVTKSDLQEVYNSVVKNNFFSLNNSYEDPFVMDGGFERATITADGSTKTVNLVNITNERFDAVTTSIYSVVNSKIETQNINFGDYCDAKKSGCEKSFTPECEEWNELCEWGFADAGETQ